MYYEIYLDRMFLLHFPMHFLLLSLTGVFLEHPLSLRRRLWISAVQTLWFLAAFLAPAGKVLWPVKMLFLFAGNLGCLWIAFGFQSWRALANSGVWYIAAAAGIGGTLAAWKVEGQALGILVTAALTALGGGLFLCLKRRREKQPLWNAEIRNGDVQIRITALMDSGNSLYDPVSGRPVCIVTRETAQKVKLFEHPERFRAIPYHTVGEKGILQAAFVNQMYLQKGEHRLERTQVLLAVSKQPLSAAGQYQMLLHPALFVGADENLREEKKGDPKHDTQSRCAGKDAV